jgi:Na+/H+ antiporter NhaD/arsenite permease-like protein
MIAILILFLAGYLFIVFEHEFKTDKTAVALISGILCWIVYVFLAKDQIFPITKLQGSFQNIAGILILLLGAMTMVKIIDLHDGFGRIINKLQKLSQSDFTNYITLITFLLSSVMDNFTTAILMTTIVRKVTQNKQERWLLLSMIVIAANAGGAWSVLGDVTTSMLWIGGQINPVSILKYALLPAIAVVIVPLIIVRKLYPRKKEAVLTEIIEVPENNGILFTGLALLLVVPLISSTTKLPPYMGMMLVLGILWVINRLFKTVGESKNNSINLAAQALESIDVSSILFFFGILIGIASLQASGMLDILANFFLHGSNSIYMTGSIMGICSSVIDNVPLVAAAQVMFDHVSVTNGKGFWEFISLTTGTGGSILIIGSAAGIAVMGMEQIPFRWYLKHISWIAILGFMAGILVFIAQRLIF